MFKLPEKKDYYECVASVKLPDELVYDDKGNVLRRKKVEGDFIAKFRYMPQSWIESLNNRNHQSDEEQRGLIDEVLYGFKGVMAPDGRELDDTSDDDRAYLIKEGDHSIPFCQAIYNAFTQSITKGKGKNAKQGN